MSKYLTLQGDMWDSIAHKLYGDTIYTDILIRANPDYREIYIFSEGIVLTVPEIEQRSTANDLPPWKRTEG